MRFTLIRTSRRFVNLARSTWPIYDRCVPFTDRIVGRAESPHRALTVSILLLVLAAALAWQMARRREGDPLGERNHPRGWTISFRAPRFMLEGESIRRGQEEIVLFYSPLGDAAELTLAFRRVPVRRDTTAIDVCRQVYNARAGWLSGLYRFTFPRPARSELTGKEAVQVIDQRLGLVVRAIVLPRGQAYAVSLSVESGSAIKLSDDLLGLFERVCDSVQLEHPRG